MGHPVDTGKTRFGIELIKEAIGKKGILPERILYASFTRAASYEARRRAMESYPDFGEDRFPYFRTIHSIAFQLLNLNRHAMFDGRRLRDFADTFKYKFSDDALDKDLFKQDLIDMVLGTEADAYLAFDEWRKNRLILDIDDAIRQFRRKQSELPRGFNERALKLFLERKEEYKRSQGLWEFSDLLLKVYLDEIPLDVDFVVIDETQDNSPLLHAVAEIWSRNAKEVYLIGDPDQSIYTFMGADPSIMIDWKRNEDIVLRQSHRCSKAVHDLSRRVVERMRLRYHSDFIPTGTDGSVSRVSLYNLNLDGDGTTYCLFRTRYLMDNFIEYLLAKGVPFSTKRGDYSPIDKGESGAVYLLHRLANGGSITIQELHKLVKYIPQEPYLKRGAKTDIADRARDNPKHKISVVSLSALGFTPEFIHLLDNGEYVESLKINSNEKRYYRIILSKYGVQALIDKPKIEVGTIHSVKGLESDRVVLSPELTRLPYENLIQNPDEEHRVIYVGITRARDEVQILLPEHWRSYPL